MLLEYTLSIDVFYTVRYLSDIVITTVFIIELWPKFTVTFNHQSLLSSSLSAKLKEDALKVFLSIVFTKEIDSQKPKEAVTRSLTNL